ncbi:MAG: lytic transglycosylase, partial [Lysobacterales bacterium]
MRRLLFPLALAALAAASLSGCATTGSRTDDYSSLPTAPHRAPARSGPTNADATPVLPPIPAYRGDPAVGPQQHADLLDRIRAGYTLPQAQHYLVDREIDAYRAHPDYLDRTFRRGARYLYHIVSEIERRGMPLELALLPVVESAFNPVAYSRSRASGLWQFIPSTGKYYGLAQNWWIDERRDVLKATDAALTYLAYLHDYF